MFGKLADLRFINRLYMYQFSILSIGITSLLLPLANNYAGLVSYALVFGFFDGCFVGQIAVITADVVGHEKMSQAIGNMFGTLAIPMSLGPPFAGQNYFIAGGRVFCFFKLSSNSFKLPKGPVRTAALFSRGVTTYNGLYGKAPPERGTLVFFTSSQTPFKYMKG